MFRIYFQNTQLAICTKSKNVELTFAVIHLYLLVVAKDLPSTLISPWRGNHIFVSIGDESSLFGGFPAPLPTPLKRAV